MSRKSLTYKLQQIRNLERRLDKPHAQEPGRRAWLLRMIVELRSKWLAERLSK